MGHGIVFEPMPIIGKHHLHPYSNAVLFHSDHRRDLPLAPASRLTPPKNGNRCCASTPPARRFRADFAARILVSRFVAKPWPAFRALWRESGIQAGSCGRLQKRASADEPEVFAERAPPGQSS